MKKTIGMFERGTRVIIVNPKTGEVKAEGRVLDYVGSRFGRLVRLEEHKRVAWPASWATHGTAN